MTPTKLKQRALGASTIVACGAALLVPQVAAAHHNTITCQSPGVWLIVNAEEDLAETFTTDQGHSGSITAGGSTTVEYSGTRLTVYGTWTNGATNSSSGEGDCTVETTTTTVAPTTTQAPATTEATTTTLAPATTEAPTTTAPPATTDGPSTTDQPGTTVSGTTIAPPTTLVAGDSGERPQDPDGGTPDVDPGDAALVGGTLPSTGVDSSVGAAIGGSLILVGGALFAGRRKPSAAR